MFPGSPCPSENPSCRISRSSLYRLWREPAFQVSCGCLIYHRQLAGSVDTWNVLNFRSCQSVRPYLLGSLKTQNMYRRGGGQGKGCRRLQELVLTAPLKAMAPHSSIPAWKIPWTEEPGGLHAYGNNSSISSLDFK